ncbi:U2AF65A [Symbiodinium microadriaticum]|nr:U2AF65A [Symbiodinium microadriaticum]
MSESIDIASMDCTQIMEFVYISRLKIWQQLDQHLAEVNASAPADPLRISSRASSLLSAHVHIITAVSSQRAECFSEHVRLLLTVSLRRMKALATPQVKQLWHASQDGLEDPEGASRLKTWLIDAAGLLDADLRTLKTVLQTWTPPSLAESRFYSHEALRRDTFEEYTLDKGLLQGLLRSLPVDSFVADFGAGSGQYARWLNDTGLVKAFAFDGSPDINLVTRGAVAAADLGKPLTLWRRFDWSLCLEVAEHIPTDLTPTFLQNLDQYTATGLVLTWARPGLQGLGTANPLTQEQVLALIREHTGLIHVDEELTKKLRAASTIPHLADTLLVMVREPSQTVSVPSPQPLAWNHGFQLSVVVILSAMSSNDNRDVEQHPQTGEVPQPTAEEPAVKREVLAPVVPSMTTITFLITLNIQPTAETEKIREILAQLAQSVAAKPGASFYQSYQKRPDQIEFIETFRDSDAALWHLQNQDQALAALWFTQIALESITIIGPASEALRNELAGYPLANKPVYIAGLSGFPPQVN